MQPNNLQPESRNRQAFRRARITSSPYAHMLTTAMQLSPLLMAEFVKDAEKRWRYNRILILTGTLASQGLWAAKVHRERRECEERSR